MIIDDVIRPDPPLLDEIMITAESGTLLNQNSNFQVFHEGTWVPGRFGKNIRIDQPSYGAGQRHAHVLGRKGDEIGVVNVDGTSSHGTKMKLHPNDAAALRGRGFRIPVDGIVEWTRQFSYDTSVFILLG